MLPAAGGVDGCVMAVALDLAKDPEKESKFMAALASNNHGSVPIHIAAIRSLNAAYGTDFSEKDYSDHSVLRESMKGQVGEYLASHFKCPLPLYSGMELTFLELLARKAESRIKIAKGIYRSD